MINRMDQARIATALRQTRIPVPDDRPRDSNWNAALDQAALAVGRAMTGDPTFDLQRFLDDCGVPR